MLKISGLLDSWNQDPWITARLNPGKEDNDDQESNISNLPTIPSESIVGQITKIQVPMEILPTVIWISVTSYLDAKSVRKFRLPNR
jgi:hypothetical protein